MQKSFFVYLTFLDSISERQAPMLLRSVVYCLQLSLVSCFLHLHHGRQSGCEITGKFLLNPYEKSFCRSTTHLFYDDTGGAGSGGRPLTASERERRDEEQRRQDRASDVVIGKTSAISGESDYALDISATEEEWMRQATNVEQEIYRKTEKGMKHLKMLNLEESWTAFDRVFQLRPNAYLWQAGIVKYYLNELEDAASILAQSANHFESRFGEPATEERIWRNACELKLKSSIPKQELRRIEAQIPGGIAAQLKQISKDSQNCEDTARLLSSERRKVLRTARELFDASVRKDHCQVIVSRAQLRCICGAFNNPKEQGPDKKMWKLNAWFYLGLHYDAMGQIENSKNCMKMALRLCPSAGNAPDLVHTLPMLHMARRNWFDDDDDFDSHLFMSPDSIRMNHMVLLANTDSEARERVLSTDPLLAVSLKQGVEELRVEELKDALLTRGIRATSGSKRELQTRLVDSLMEDSASM